MEHRQRLERSTGKWVCPMEDRGGNMPKLELRGRKLSGRRSEGFLLLGRTSLLVIETSSTSTSSLVLPCTVPSFPVLLLSLTRPFSFLLLLLEGGLVWTALYSADLFGLVLVGILGAL